MLAISLRIASSCSWPALIAGSVLVVGFGFGLVCLFDQRVGQITQPGDDVPFWPDRRVQATGLRLLPDLVDVVVQRLSGSQLLGSPSLGESGQASGA
ncbi:hypothetical protein [Micromonospora sp. NPDC049374]|uniref:hypothetical protein n=1 Tax=Micromonospora sp. NPDC049374 TaxID=3154352 RepID=UPI0034165130